MDFHVWTVIFFVLAGFALLTQTARARSVTYVVRGPVKAAPAFFLAGVSWYLNGPPLLTVAFLLCGCGDILLDLAKATFIWAFEAGVYVFAAALLCLAYVYAGKPVSGYPLLLLSLPNIVIAVFVCALVLPKIESPLRARAAIYLGLLVASNITASTSLVPIFLGSTLWLLSDLAIAVSRYIPGTPANALTNLGLYDLGLYFIAMGFLKG